MGHEGWRVHAWIWHYGSALAVKDKVIVGPAGGKRGIAGFLAAYDKRTSAPVTSRVGSIVILFTGTAKARAMLH